LTDVDQDYVGDSVTKNLKKQKGRVRGTKDSSNIGREKKGKGGA